MLHKRWRPRSRTLIIVTLTLAALGGTAVAFIITRDTGDVSNKAEFRAEPAALPQAKKAQTKRDQFVWGTYGYTKDRRSYLPASKSLRPPFRQVWKFGGSVLLEFSPVLGDESLFLLKNDGLLVSLAQKTGRRQWDKKLGELAASSPAYDKGRVYVTLLKRSANVNAGRVAALKAKTGKILWSRPLPTRTESSPLVDKGQVIFGSEGGTVYSLGAKDGKTNWEFKAAGAVKGGVALKNGKLYFGDYAGQVYCIRRSDGHQIWRTGTSGARYGLSSGQFYATPAVAYDRVYLGNTDGNVYSFTADEGKLAWRKGTGSYVYASPAVARVPGGKPTVYVGSYDGNFYALDAKSGDARWTHHDGGNISGGATVVGDIVYFSNLRHKSTVGLNARSGKKEFETKKGAFHPVISDGKTIYLNSYTSLYALRPKKSGRASRSYTS